MEKAVYSVGEVCSILGLSRTTVLKMVSEGMLAAIKLPRKILILKTSLDNLLKAG